MLSSNEVSTLQAGCLVIMIPCYIMKIDFFPLQINFDSSYWTIQNIPYQQILSFINKVTTNSSTPHHICIAAIKCSIEDFVLIILYEVYLLCLFIYLLFIYILMFIFDIHDNISAMVSRQSCEGTYIITRSIKCVI